MDPISNILRTGGGEAAILHIPPVTAGYDPKAHADYQPNAPGGLAVRGYPHDVEAVDGATAGFTFQATAVPAGLKVNEATLDYAGATWRVVRFRPRHYRGRVNGVTLHLAI